jgi:hypothetical protein
VIHFVIEAFSAIVIVHFQRATKAQIVKIKFHQDETCHQSSQKSKIIKENKSQNQAGTVIALCII